MTPEYSQNPESPDKDNMVLLGEEVKALMADLDDLNNIKKITQSKIDKRIALIKKTAATLPGSADLLITLEEISKDGSNDIDLSGQAKEILKNDFTSFLDKNNQHSKTNQDRVN